jgi:hypothetical protein
MHGATARSGKYVLRTLSIPTKIPEKIGLDWNCGNFSWIAIGLGLMIK